MSKTQNIIISDEIGAFINSDGWRMVKWRLEVYKGELDKKLKSQIRAGRAGADTLSAIDTVDEVIKITERLGNEVRQNKFDADVALASLKIMR